MTQERKKMFVKVNQEKGIAQINNIRVVLRSLWEPNIYKGKDTGRQVAHFEVPKEDLPEFKKVMDLALGVYRQTKSNAKNVNDGLEYPRFTKSKYTEGALVFRTSNDAKYPAKYFDLSGSLVRDPKSQGVEHTVLYAGCYCNIKVQFTKVKSGEGFWSNLVAIQFAGHGDAVGGLSDADAAEGFDVVEGDFGDFGMESSVTSDNAVTDDADQTDDDNVSDTELDDLF